MKNKEIEEILYVLKDIVIGRATRLTCREVDKLLSYIEQLEKKYKELKDRNEITIDRNIEAYRIVEQLEKNRDKAIEYFKFENPEIFKNPKYTNHLWTIDGLTIKRFIDKLKGDSDD